MSLKKEKKNSGKSEPERLVMKGKEEAGIKFRGLTVQNNQREREGERKRGGDRERDSLVVFE